MTGEGSNIPRFAAGDVIRHLHYEYRGVIIGHDKMCQANDEWYQKNATQPDRNQPWYQVLVHGSTRSTYVAETNITADECGEQIIHPLVKNYFARFQQGRYVPYKGDEQNR
jgi:heat shock protein HspQ